MKGVFPRRGGSGSRSAGGNRFIISSKGVSQVFNPETAFVFTQNPRKQAANADGRRDRRRRETIRVSN